MKPTRNIITLAAFAAVAFTSTLHATTSLPAPLLEFLSREQAAKWQIDRVAKTELKKDTIREQEAIQFYTGKPYDSSSESYLFKYRTYYPELSRWTSVDPSGFPDGANNHAYLPNPCSQVDYQGLETVDNISQALAYWGRENGSTADSVTAGSGVVGNLKNSSGFQDLIYNIQVNRINPQLRNVSTSSYSGTLEENAGRGPAALGFVDLVLGRTSTSYSDTSDWEDISGWTQNSADQWGRWLKATTVLTGSISDYFIFEDNAGDPDWMNFLEETFPGWIAGPGTSFAVTGSYDHIFDTYAWQPE